MTFKTLWADYTNPNGGDLSDYKPYRYGFSAAYTRNINHIFNISVPVRFLNGKLKDEDIEKFCILDDESRDILQKARINLAIRTN